MQQKGDPMNARDRISGESLRALAGRAAACVAVTVAMTLGAAIVHAADPIVIVSIQSGGGTTVCDTNCTVCTIASGECINVVEEDLIMCKPLSSGIPITSCDWSLFLKGDSANLQINNQIRAADVAPNGNITFV